MLPLISLKSKEYPSFPVFDANLYRISQPEIKAPWAISMAMLFTYVAGFLFNIVLCFCMVRPGPSLYVTHH